MALDAGAVIVIDVGVDVAAFTPIGPSITEGTNPAIGTDIWLGWYSNLAAILFATSCTGAGTDLPPDADPPFPPVWPYPWDTSLIYGRENLAQNIRMTRADTLTFDIAVTLNGSAVNLTGGTLKLSAKFSPLDANAVFTCDSAGDGISVTSAVDGEATVTIAKTKTDVAAIPYRKVFLFYDIQFVNSASERFTVQEGKLIITPDITRTP